MSARKHIRNEALEEAARVCDEGGERAAMSMNAAQNEGNKIRVGRFLGEMCMANELAVLIRRMKEE